MIANIKYRLTTNWHMMRWLRLFLGAAILLQAFMSADWMIGMLSGILLVQALFDVGCCSGGACYTSYKEDKSENKQVIYEEINEKK